MNKRFVFTIVMICSAVSSVAAQSLIGEATLPTVSQDGFYKIVIPPLMMPYVTPAFANLRITDEQQREVPYYGEVSTVTQSDEFIPYKIVVKEHQRKCCTSLVLENTLGNDISNIHLVIRNADVSKRATLTGSDDQKDWYALKQSFQLYGADGGKRTSEVKIVDFPRSNYRYYKLLLNDSTSDPLNILSAGYYTLRSSAQSTVRLPDWKVTIADSSRTKQTYIWLTHDTTQWVDVLSLSASTTPFFYRHATLYESKVVINKKGKRVRNLQHIRSISLRSGDITSVDLSGVRAKELLLIIDNQDNPPLQFDAVELFQQTRYLVAYLKKDQAYKLKIGDAALHQPQYDLKYFKANVPMELPSIELGKLKLYDNENDKRSSESLFKNPYWIWIAIVAVIAFLGFMSIRMIRETAQSAKEEK